MLVRRPGCSETTRPRSAIASSRLGRARPGRAVDAAGHDRDGRATREEGAAVCGLVDAERGAPLMTLWPIVARSRPSSVASSVP